MLAEDIKSDALPQPCVLERSRLDVLYGELFDCERETELDWWLDDAQVTLAPPTNSIHIPSSILPTRRRPEYSDKQHTCCSATGTFFFFFFFAFVPFGHRECGETFSGAATAMRSSILKFFLFNSFLIQNKLIFHKIF